MLLNIAIGLFVIGAVFGAIVLTAVLRDRPTPKPVVFIHGLFVATAVVLLGFAYFTEQHDKLLGVILGLFVIAALGGLTLFMKDILHKPIPKWLALLHPLVAATALVLLILYVLPKPV